MRLRRKTIVGRIDGNGNLDCFWGEMNEFLKMHKGKNVIIRAEIMPTEPSKKTKGYYYGYVLPTLTRAFYDIGNRLTEYQVDNLLRSQCPSIQEESWEGGEYRTRVRSFDSLDQAEAVEYIEWLKEYAGENLNCIIDDPWKK